MKHLIWVSYDLGVSGDYEGMYAWLDGHGAKECGDSLASLSYEHPNADVVEDLKADIQSAVSLAPRNRIYVIRQEDGKMKGKFVFGSRRSSPWTGYAVSEEQVEDTQ